MPVEGPHSHRESSMSHPAQAAQRLAVRYVPGPPRSAELVVVGGGIVGAASAFHAARLGIAVTLVEAELALVSATTPKATGGFRLQLETEDEYRFVRRSVDALLNFAEYTGQRTYGASIQQRGYLWAARRDETATRQFEIAARHRSWGLNDIEVLEGADARKRFPFLADEVVRARFRRGDGFVDPVAVALGLTAASRAKVVTNCRVIGFEIQGGRIRGLVTTAGAISTETCVIAAGPLSGVVADLAGVSLPVTLIRRQKVVLPNVPEAPQDAPLVIDEETHAHWRPGMQGGAFALFPDPAEQPRRPTADVPADASFAYRVLDPSSPVSVAHVSPFWRRVWERGSSPWYVVAGLYTMTPDHRPLIGPTAVEGLLVNTGYSGHGVMGAIAGGEVLAEHLAGVGLSDTAHQLHPDRAFEALPAAAFS